MKFDSSKSQGSIPTDAKLFSSIFQNEFHLNILMKFDSSKSQGSIPTDAKLFSSTFRNNKEQPGLDSDRCQTFSSTFQNDFHLKILMKFDSSKSQGSIPTDAKLFSSIFQNEFHLNILMKFDSSKSQGSIPTDAKLFSYTFRNNKEQPGLDSDRCQTFSSTFQNDFHLQILMKFDSSKSQGSIPSDAKLFSSIF